MCGIRTGAGPAYGFRVRKSGGGTRPGTRRAFWRRRGAWLRGCRSRRCGRDLLDAVGGVLQEAARLFEADQIDVPARGHAGLRLEGAGEVAWREAGAGGERLDGEVVVGVLGDPVLDLAQRLAPRGLGGELGAELGLVPRASQEHDEVAGDRQRGVAAVVLLDEREGEVDARGDAGRGRHVPVAYVDGVRVDLDGGVVAREAVAVRPVRGRPAAVEQARLGEQDSARADGDETWGARAVLPQPGGQARIRAARAAAAGDEERVRRGRVGECVVGDEREPAGRADETAVEGGGADAVRVRGARPLAEGSPGEDLCRAGHVQALDVVEQQDEHGAGGHTASVRARHDGRNDEFPTFPAIGPGAVGAVRPAARRTVRRMVRAPHVPPVPTSR